MLSGDLVVVDLERLHRKATKSIPELEFGAPTIDVKFL